MMLPVTQWLGRGLGHIGSTSKRGAWTVAALTEARLPSTTDPIPSVTTTAAKAAPTRRLRFIFLPCLSRNGHLSAGSHCTPGDGVRVNARFQPTAVAVGQSHP